MLKQYRDIDRGEFIVVGVDGSEGLNDNSVAQFISKTHNDVPLIYVTDKMLPDLTDWLFPVLEMISTITKVNPLVAYERNDGGIFEMVRLAKLNRDNLFDIYVMKHKGDTDSDQRVNKTLGWHTNGSTRSEMLMALKDCLDNRLLKIYEKETIEECYSFVKVQGGTGIWKAQAEVNALDDRVMSLGIAWQLYLDSPTVYENNTDYQRRKHSRQTFNPATV